MNNKWFKMSASGKEAEIGIYGEVGWYPDDAQTFISALINLGDVDRINLHINSPGGSVLDGFAIYNRLIAHKAKITVYIDGWAASIASVIAMAGDEIIAPANTWFMIHNPWVGIGGDADDLARMVEVLEKMKSQIITAYQRHSDRTRDELSDMMDAETWMTATDAIEAGFKFAITGELNVAAKFDPMKYETAPDGAMEIFNKNKTRGKKMWDKIKNILLGKGLGKDADDEAIEAFVEKLIPENGTKLAEVETKLAEFETKLADAEKQAKADISAKDAELVEVKAELEAEKLSRLEMKTKLEDAEKKIKTLTPGLKASDEEDTRSSKEQYLAEVAVHVEAGMSHEQATVKVQRENKELFDAMIKEAN